MTDGNLMPMTGTLEVESDADHIYTDSSATYDFTINEDYRPKHRAVNHIREWIVPGTGIHTNTVENSF